MAEKQRAPGSPGVAPTWCSSAKDIVTTALGSSRVWATLGDGILNEVCWPSTGDPQIRDLGFIVAAPDGQWTEVKRLDRYELRTPQPDIPIPTVVHLADDFQLTLRVVVDDIRDCLLIDYDLQGDGHQHDVLLAPRLGSEGRSLVADISSENGERVYARALIRHTQSLPVRCLVRFEGIFGDHDCRRTSNQRGQKNRALPLESLGQDGNYC